MKHALPEDPDVYALAARFYAAGYKAGRSVGVAEGKRDRARQRKGKEGKAKPPGRPLKIHPIWNGLLEKVVKERAPRMTQVRAIEEFQCAFEQTLRESDYLDQGRREPLLDMDPNSILAILRNRSRKKE
jgi:hypothetical protein